MFWPVLVTIKLELATFSRVTSPIGVIQLRRVLPLLATTHEEQSTPMLASRLEFEVSTA